MHAVREYYLGTINNTKYCLKIWIIARAITTMIILLLPYLRDTVLENGRCAGAQTGRNTRARAHVCLLRCRVTYRRDRPVVLRSPHSDRPAKDDFLDDTRQYYYYRLTVPGDRRRCRRRCKPFPPRRKRRLTVLWVGVVDAINNNNRLLLRYRRNYR